MGCLQTSLLPGGRLRVLAPVQKLASVEQHRPRREADRIGHQNDDSRLQSARRGPIPTYRKSSASLSQVSDARMERRLFESQPPTNVAWLALLASSSALWGSPRSPDMSSFIFIRIPMISDLPAVCLNFHFDNSEQTWRHLATLGKRQPLPPFTRVCLNFNHLGRRGDIIKKINTNREGSLSTSAIYHELSRRQPKLEKKCVNVGIDALAVVW